MYIFEKYGILLSKKRDIYCKNLRFKTYFNKTTKFPSRQLYLLKFEMMKRQGFLFKKGG